MKDGIYSVSSPIILEGGPITITLPQQQPKQSDPPHPCGTIQRLSEAYREQQGTRRIMKRRGNLVFEVLP